MRSIATPGFRRRKPAPVWHFLNRLIAFLILLGLAGLIVVLFQPQVAKLGAMKAALSEIERDKELAKIENLRLQREKNLLESDPEYIENIARDKLDLMKPGETIYRIDPRPTP
jgi:cell division protein FtsB